MGDFLKTLLEVFVNGRVKLIHKILFTILTIIFILIIDNVTGFTFYRNISNRITNLKEIAAIQKDTSIDKETKDYAKRLLTELKEHNSIYERFFVSSLNTTDTNSNNAHINPATPTENTTDSPILFYIFLFLASSGEYFVLAAYMFFYAVLSKKHTLKQKINYIIDIPTKLLFLSLINFLFPFIIFKTGASMLITILIALAVNVGFLIFAYVRDKILTWKDINT